MEHSEFMIAIPEGGLKYPELMVSLDYGPELKYDYVLELENAEGSFTVKDLTFRSRITSLLDRTPQKVDDFINHILTGCDVIPKDYTNCRIRIAIYEVITEHIVVINQAMNNECRSWVAIGNLSGLLALLGSDDE